MYDRNYIEKYRINNYNDLIFDLHLDFIHTLKPFFLFL